MTELVGRLDACAENMAVIAGHLPEALRRVEEYAGRDRAINLGAHQRGGSGSTADEKDGLRCIIKATNDLAAARAALVRLTADTRMLAALVDFYQPVAAVPDDHPICECCRQIHVVSDVYRNRDGKPLCRWCHDFTVDHKQWPPIEILRRHHERGRVTVQQIEAAMRRQPTLSRRKNKGAAA